jgi:hypothetical protein
MPQAVLMSLLGATARRWFDAETEAVVVYVGRLLAFINVFVQACPNVFRAESAVCRLDRILGSSEYAKALYPAEFSRTG